MSYFIEKGLLSINKQIEWGEENHRRDHKSSGQTHEMLTNHSLTLIARSGRRPRSHFCSAKTPEVYSSLFLSLIWLCSKIYILFLGKDRLREHQLHQYHCLKNSEMICSNKFSVPGVISPRVAVCSFSLFHSEKCAKQSLFNVMHNKETCSTNLLLMRLLLRFISFSQHLHSRYCYHMWLRWGNKGSKVNGQNCTTKGHYSHVLLARANM